jgi:hypothetical protein
LIPRTTVEGYEDATETELSNTRLLLHPAIVEALLWWRQQSSFNADMGGVGLLSNFQGSQHCSSNLCSGCAVQHVALTPLDWVG